jgi:UDPglucose 6-dehydrogenase
MHRRRYREDGIVKLGIIGHGFVGKAMAALFEGRHEVAIYDIVSAPSPHYLAGSSLILICVPTPSAADGSCDTSAVRSAAQIARVTAPGALICIKSAVSPGTTDELNKIHNTDVFHASPEYIGEGKNYVPPWEYPDPRDPRTHDFVIVGGPRAGEVLDIFQTVMATTARYEACSAIEAELVKRFENAFLATKVAFCTLAAELTRRHGSTWHRLRELWLLDSRIGRSHTASFAGAPGFGGKCLPKDLAALIHEAEKAGVDPALLRAVQAYGADQ